MFKTIIVTDLERLKMSKRKCGHCGDRKLKESMFITPLMAFCNRDHAAQYAFNNKQKGSDKIHREKKRSFRQSDLRIRKAAAKKACHEYIRYRDRKNNCICCGRKLGDKFDAGHFLESGNNPRIRYDEDNIHGQSVYCNQYQGGDSDDYRGRLIQKIGVTKVERLESLKGGTVKRTAEDYIEIESYYKQKLKELQNES